MSGLKRILSRVRIHGGDSGVSARATHHNVEKDLLITYVSALSSQAELRTVRGSTTERKKMSTKTTFKRVALVTVAALGMGVLTSVAPASAAVTATFTAAPWNVTVAQAGTSTAAGTQVVGGYATLTFSDTATVTSATSIVYSVTSTGVGTISGATKSGTNHDITALGTTAGVETFPTNGLSMVATTSASSEAGVMTISVNSNVAGTQTLTATTYDASGTPGTTYTATITWVAGSSVDAATVKAFVLANGATCDGTQTASTQGSMSTSSSASALVLCVSVHTAAPALWTRGTATYTVIGNGIGQAEGAAVYSGTSTSGYKAIAIKGNGLAGTSKFDITVSTTNADATTNTKTASVSLINYGDFTTITLANLKKSIAASTGTAAITYSGTDSAKNQTAFSLSGATWYVESDKGTVAVSSTAPNNSSATIANTTAAGITALTGASDALAVATITAGSAYEKLTIWATKANAAGTTITSNKIVVYVSTGTAKTVTVAASDATASGSQTVSVTALSDPATTTTAYPVVDGESIVLGVTAGSLAASTVLTGITGTADFTYFGSQLSGDITFSASAESGTVLGSKKITVKGGALESLTTLVNSLIKKINAMQSLLNKIQKKLGVK
jgi:hypothetical protein